MTGFVHCHYACQSIIPQKYFEGCKAALRIGSESQDNGEPKMDDNALDKLLRKLATEAPMMDAGPEFHDSLWQRIGQMTEAREHRRRTILGLAIFAIGLGAGMGTQYPVPAQPVSYTLADGADLAPSTLLHVAP
ncbi:hypothetical protein [Novosphingobium indicum]|nr:hypothetical protein [Novosphingobium indicum]